MFLHDDRLVRDQIICRQDFFNQSLVCIRHDSFRISPAVTDLFSQLPCFGCKCRCLRNYGFIDVYLIVWVLVIVNLEFGAALKHFVPHRLTQEPYDYRSFTRASAFVRSVSKSAT